MVNCGEVVERMKEGGWSAVENLGQGGATEQSPQQEPTSCLAITFGKIEASTRVWNNNNNVHEGHSLIL